MDMKICSKCGVEKELSEFYLTRYGNPAAACKVCAKLRSRAAALANPEKVKANQKRFYEAHPEKSAEYAKAWAADPENKAKRQAAQNAWRKNNPEKRAALEARYHVAHPEKMSEKKARYYVRYRDELKAKVMARARAFPEKVAATNARYYRAHPEKWIGRPQWQKLHPERHAAKEGLRRAAKFQATPVWADKELIDSNYALARLLTEHTGYEWHVDHEVPLKSKLVCGLHVEANLRVIPGKENLSKSNRYWPDMPAA